jgi:HAD superfamily hydrolase (TIGR01509 family)
MRFHATALGKNEEEIVALHLDRDKHYLKLISNNLTAIEGVEEGLKLLHGKVQMAIVTSSLPEHFQVIHQQTQLTRYFEHILTRDFYQFAKPHPEPYLTAAKYLGVNPHECIVVEDTERGFRSAQAAGMECVVIPNRLLKDGDYSGAAAIVANAKAAAEFIYQHRISTQR